MKILKRLQINLPWIEADNIRFASLDRFTKNAAISMSRRGFLRRIVAFGAAAAGSALLEVRVVFADHCNQCNGSCACTSEISQCCSPNGLYCYYKKCVRQYCPPGGPLRAYIIACNDNTVGHGCENC